MTVIEQLRDTYKGEITKTVLEYMFRWQFGNNDWFIIIGDGDRVWTMDPKTREIIADNWCIKR